MGFIPFHPAVAYLPIAFVLLSVCFDFCARISHSERRRASFRAVGFWALVAAMAGAPLAIWAGYWDSTHDALRQDTSALMGLHAKTGWILIAGLALVMAWRWLIRHRGQMTINTGYLVSAAAVLGLTLFQAWYGSEMVYSYGAGVASDGQGLEPPESAQARLAAFRSLVETGPAAGGAEIPGGTNQSVRPGP